MFWWDTWLEEEPLVHHYNNITSLNNIRVSQFLVKGHWNESMVRRHAPPLLVPKILNTAIHYQENAPNKAMWKLNDNGIFSCS
ncbi:hypothetical protein H5410_040682 [Solanum commersonii]|uniref:Uncharacterized protein n=1 Tax=Solanum commersonii TaxID=4109 RepID=A0A9J5XSP1_SOLCO|nr:hypothetical protein H5410_040682 [Solanum commersonii]